MRNSLPAEEITARIEAALYSAGRPLSNDELVRASGTNSKSTTRKVVNELIKKTKSVFTAIEITELSDGTFVLQLKPGYTPLIKRFAQRPLIPTSALKTLSYIAYEQPVTSKRLVQIRGSQVYVHLKTLKQMGFIELEKVGMPKAYRTTKKFRSYFGVTDLESLRNSLVTTSTNQEK
ncbi:MAG TPA: SMC-Scp complex subunit ScpB [Candidatus Nitrosopolaris sp.]|nr:SMC-Scp complex subunit ScpB [Candidatus Nitrosopolaris sp.]